MPKKFQILRKRILTPEISAISVYAPLIAAKARAGQFIILRANGEGERIPLTISSHEGDGVTVEFQKAGASTLELDQLQEGDCLADFAGPLGQPTPIARHGRVAVVGGGLGCAIALPVAQALKEAGNTVDLIGGFKTRHLIILEEELRAASNTLYLCTDDGSFGYGGFVTDQLKELMVNGATYGHIFAIGPLIMMKAVTRAAQSAGIPVTVSMSPLMIDGTGIKAGDALIGVASSGVHSNGYSLVRKTLGINEKSVRRYIDEFGKTLGEELLTPTKIYVKAIQSLMGKVEVKGISHITGGGFYENVPRMLPAGIVAKIEKAAMPVPPVFDLIAKTGKIPERDMYNTFNMGAGLVLAVAAEDASRAVAAISAAGEQAYVIGECVNGAEKGVELV